MLCRPHYYTWQSTTPTWHALVRMVEHHVWLTGEMIERGARLDATALDALIVASRSTVPIAELRARLGQAF